MAGASLVGNRYVSLLTLARVGSAPRATIRNLHAAELSWCVGIFVAIACGLRSGGHGKRGGATILWPRDRTAAPTPRRRRAIIRVGVDLRITNRVVEVADLNYVSECCYALRRRTCAAVTVGLDHCTQNKDVVPRPRRDPPLSRTRPHRPARLQRPRLFASPS